MRQSSFRGVNIKHLDGLAPGVGTMSLSLFWWALFFFISLPRCSLNRQNIGWSRFRRSWWGMGV
jgi:hypothetical protein